MDKKKKTMTREEAMQLYTDLQKAMTKIVKNKGHKNLESAIQSVKKQEAPRASAASSIETVPPPMRLRETSGHGQVGRRAAVLFIVAFAIAKMSMVAIEQTGLFGVESAEASYAAAPKAPPVTALPPGTFSREEVKVLTSLDSRRAELEERGKKIDERELELDRRDREFAARLTQLREMTATLKLDREKGEKKRNGQIEQLANVYGSMNPTEAAALMEQLDVTIALALLEKMPEKRIGQILALMTPERALALTRMLSGKTE